MRFLNHTDIKTTMHYLNIDDDSEVLIDALWLDNYQLLIWYR
jgi:hypothetical protein